jgi:hypothetical protein
VIVALWIGLGVCAAGLVFLGLVVAGQLRAMDDLRRRVETSRAIATDAGVLGLQIGATAPAFDGRRHDGSRFASESLAGRRHLVVLADADCAACETLVPELLGAPPAPAVIVVDGADIPPGWRAEARSGVEVVRSTGAADLFGAGVRPALFVVDEGGGVVGRGVASTGAEAATIVDEAAGTRIVPAPPAAAMDPLAGGSS